MSNLSELLPSGGGQNVVEFTASGAVASGKPVILNNDGTVTEVGTISESTGSESVYESAATYGSTATYDVASGKIVIAYQDNGNSGYGTAVVGTVSGTSITFGTPVVFETASTQNPSITYDANAEKVVIAYRDNGNSGYGAAIVGTVSGTSISFGTATNFANAATDGISIVYDSNAQKVVIAYEDETSNLFYGKAIVGTVSGTSISFGSATTFESANVKNITTAYDSTAQKVVIGYDDNGNSSYGTAIVGTVSGTSISFGTAVVFESATTTEVNATYDSSNDKTVIFYQDAGNNNYGTAIVGTVSGTSISFGTAVVFESAEYAQAASTFDSVNGKVVTIYRDGGNSNYGTYIVGTVSGTSISFGTASVYNNASTNNQTAAFDSSEGICVFGYRDFGNSNYGTAICLQNESTNLTATNFIGLASAAISDTATGDINVKGGINEAQSGLTIGSDYYVQSDGTVSTTSTSPAVKVGKAITATTINMMDLT